MFQVQVFTYIWCFFYGKCRYIKHGSCGSHSSSRLTPAATFAWRWRFPCWRSLGMKPMKNQFTSTVSWWKKPSAITWQYTLKCSWEGVPGFEMDRTPMNYLAILRVIFFGMVKWSFQGLRDLQLGDQQLTDQQLTDWITWYCLFTLKSWIYKSLSIASTSTHIEISDYYILIMSKFQSVTS